MKKCLLIVLLVFIAYTPSFAATALYRISSKEVCLISTSNDSFTERLNPYFAVITDATYPDGTTCRDTNHELRVLGTSKIVDGTIVRNATQTEINTFAQFEADDFHVRDTEKALKYLRKDPRFRKIMTAFTDIIKDEFNIVRKWTRDYKAEVAAATSLSDLKSRVATMPTLNDRTLGQLKAAIENRISKDD